MPTGNNMQSKLSLIYEFKKEMLLEPQAKGNCIYALNSSAGMVIGDEPQGNEPVAIGNNALVFFGINFPRWQRYEFWPY